MPLYNHNGKLLTIWPSGGVESFRGCCCCTWKLAAVAYTRTDGDPSCETNQIYLPSTEWPYCYYGTLASVAQTVCDATQVNLYGLPHCCRIDESHMDGTRAIPTIQNVVETGNTGHATATLGLGVCHEDEPRWVYTFNYDFVKATS